MPKKSSPTIGTLSLGGAAFLYSTYAIFTRYIGLSLGVFSIFAVRSFFVGLLLIPILLIFKDWKKVSLREWPWIFVWTLTSTISGITTIIAYNNIPIAMALFLFYA